MPRSTPLQASQIGLGQIKSHGFVKTFKTNLAPIRKTMKLMTNSTSTSVLLPGFGQAAWSL